jgi:L-serine dehydratase
MGKKLRYKFHSADELLKLLDAENISMPDFALRREVFLSGADEAAVTQELDRRIAVTRASIDKGITQAQFSASGLVRGAAAKYNTATRCLIEDPLFRRAVNYALAINETNACGGKIVAFPTAGSSGIVPGVIWAYIDTRCKDANNKQDLLRGAFSVAGIAGTLIAQRADMAGAEGGCQAECGAAGAMAACALAYLCGLSNAQCFSAAALSLKNSLGLTCDPIAGLVEVPCVKRNAFVAVNVLASVDLVIAGIESAVPFDEVLAAMKQTGDGMSSAFKETSRGGLALSPTACAVQEKLGITF